MGRLSHPFIAELKRYVASQNAALGPIVMMLSDIISFSNVPVKDHEQIKLKQKKLSEITDMIHAAHVFHRCVRDNNILGESDSNSKRLHQDNVMSLLVGDYLLAQSSVDLADLRYSRTVGLIAKGLEDYTRGEFLKLQLMQKKHRDIEEIHQAIEKHAQLTCGSLLSNACLSTALLAGYEDRDKSKPGTLSDNLFSIGFHTGAAHRLIELLYHPDANSEEERILIQSLDASRFVESIDQHIDRSIGLIEHTVDKEKRSKLVETLCKMKEKCSPSP